MFRLTWLRAARRSWFFGGRTLALPSDSAGRRLSYTTVRACRGAYDYPARYYSLENRIRDHVFGREGWNYYPH